MIINICNGGISYLAITAPEGAVITASCLGLELIGSGTCILEAPIIGTWHIVCVYDGVTKDGDIAVQTFGANYNFTFTYTATIVVTTFPLASITATRSADSSTLTGTADNNGSCTLTVPAGKLGEWVVLSDNGAVEESGNVNVEHYDTSYPISILTQVPSITVKIGNDTYEYKGEAVEETYITILPVGITGWKFWMKASGTVTFNYLPSTVDVCLVGPGANGGGCWGTGSSGYYGGGDGGGGGAVNRLLGRTLEAGVEYSVTIDSTNSQLADILTSIKGGPGTKSGGNSGSGGGGAWVNDHSYPPSSGARGNGGGGVFAFDNSAAFDGVKYANGGGGGYHSGGGGVVYNTPGSGGAGGGHPYNTGLTSGLNGILIMRNAS